MATIYKVTILGRLASQLVVNGLTFISDVDEPTATNAYGLLQAMGFNPADVTEPVPGKLFDAILAASTVSYNIEEIQVRNLYSVIDFITQPVAGVGWSGQIALPTGDRLPTFVASKIKTNRVRTDIRAGSLALTGGTEEQTEGADKWNSAYQALLTDVCAALNAPPSQTVGVTTVNFRPSVLQKEEYVVNPGDEKERTAYRYWATEDEQLQHAAVGVAWGVSDDVTSQVTRKIGRGA